MAPSSPHPRHRRAANPGGGDPPRPSERRLIKLWADLLSALQQGSPGIATSAEEMAGDLPRELVVPVNRELRQRGCSFQVSLRRREAPAAAACAPARQAAVVEPPRRD
ncbi:MAG: hypothetical protein VKJ05_04915 [Synechococcaceae cyanobacterium]|nr:hypothetical protein [Synechococcaceae cyanobacterium]